MWYCAVTNRNGRYENLSVSNITCHVCAHDIEDEAHVLLHCPLYDNFREILFVEAESYDENFINLCDEQKLKFLFSNVDILRLCAKTCHLILNTRRNSIYCKKPLFIL